ncbi:MAG: cobalt-precorrin 5A hydrolase [Nitrosopumilaceae archaeon]
MEKVSVIAITKKGIQIALSLKKLFSNWSVYAPSKFSNNSQEVEWFTEPTAITLGKLFKSNDALVCIFSLGAVVRLIIPYIKDKKTDPAVIVIDDAAKFVISALSGHLGGANKLTEEIARGLSAVPVITTAADVNKTIAVDLLGREFGWKIDDDGTVTKVSAFMVNEEKIGVYQDAGEKNWWAKELPKNVKLYDTVEELRNSQCVGYLIISDVLIDDEKTKNAVVYRPLTLVVGVGLHGDTTKEKIKESLDSCFKKFKLSTKSIARFSSIKKTVEVKGFKELSEEMGIPIEYYDKEDLANINIPNPSKTVQNFEGIPSVSEASAMKSSGGKLVVEKQKFPPDLTIAIARIIR